MRIRLSVLAAVLAATPTSVSAAVPPPTPLADKVYRHPDLTERVQSHILSEPLIPGTGVGNSLRWADVNGGTPKTDDAMRTAIWSAVTGYLGANRHADTSELAAPRIAIHEGGILVQVWAQRVIDGVPVRDGSVTAVLNHGNLVLLGLQNWTDAQPREATLTAEEARAIVRRHVSPFVIDAFTIQPSLEYVPLLRGEVFDYRLAWVVRASIRDDGGTWEGLVDAATGELIAFEDKNQYVGRKAVGGVYPVSNDQRPLDGIEQHPWPLPYLNVATATGAITTDAGGHIGCAVGTLQTALVGRHVRINDACGAINETSVLGDLDLGFGPTATASDCVVPPGHSPGDTKAARSGFYELTRINQQARGYLPTNVWLQSALLANMNVNSTCGALWSGTGFVQFYRESATCRNSGEIAAIFDHEWGHGMDNNGVNPAISNPAEGIADVHAFLRLNTSCIGRGFFRNMVCGGYGNACIGNPATGCTGVRDIDFDQRACGRPATITSVTTGFPNGFCVDGIQRPACPTGTAGPCGRLGHCEAALIGETAFDLGRRDLPASGLDANTSHELATRLFFLGSQTVTAWYTCAVCGGCSATGGYLNVLAADDDDGNLANGTPHMLAIRAAFERHQIHCATPAAANSGCFGGPTAAPVVAGTPQDRAVALTWAPVTGAARYAIYQTEGVSGDTFGKVKIGETTSTSFLATELMNGRQYYFLVLPIGANSSCFGRMSAATVVTPVAAHNAGVRPTHTLSILGGDGDAFLDNCERGTVTFTVENTGTGTLTNVRLVSVTFVSPAGSILQTTLPAPIASSLAECATGTGNLSFLAQGLATGQPLQVRIEITADELGAQTRSQTFTIVDNEYDAQPVASLTYGFDADLQGWTIGSGTWTRQIPGAAATTHHVSSTENTANTCDVIRSPLLRLGASSTLAMHSRYQIEPNTPTGPVDRASVGIRDLNANTRTVISPSGGQLYTVPAGAGNGPCSTDGAGWNATSGNYPTFNQSTWSAAALNPGGAFTNRLTQIEIRYGTDGLINPAGFDYDEVTLTNFDAIGPDQFPNTCAAQAAAPQAIAVDTIGNGVLEPSEAAAVVPTWRNVGTQAIALTGALANFTGPAGATYTIVDGAASYGTIGIGAAASCASAGDCYSLNVTATTRPVTHWDTTVLETVNPTSTTKTWTLHVGSTFADVALNSPFYRFIETIVHKDVTGGCTAAA